MKTYIDLLKEIITTGTWKPNRTGIDTLSISGYMIKHNMQKGFPLLTTKKMPFKIVAVELEGFKNGITAKSWYQKLGCHIWDEWCSPLSLLKYDFSKENIRKTAEHLLLLVPIRKTTTPWIVHEKLESAVHKVVFSLADMTIEGESKPTDLVDVTKKLAQLLEDDLGPIYGFQWRAFNGYYYNQDNNALKSVPGWEVSEEGNQHNKGKDQLKIAIDLLKKDPYNRRILVNAWNPEQLHAMALQPCHYNFQLLSDGKHLDLMWNQRSCDVPLGIPFNIASYALLLELIAKETNLIANELIGALADCHIYKNQLETAKEQIEREPLELCKLEIPNFTNIYNWTHEQRKLVGYKSHSSLDYPIAV